MFEEDYFSYLDEEVKTLGNFDESYLFEDDDFDFDEEIPF